MRELDKYQGCLAGGAAGDALGYAVEFLTYEEIVRTYGPRGIVDYDLRGGVAEISDDTQMTLFTAAGLLGSGGAREGGENVLKRLERSYRDWYRTQTERFPLAGGCRASWLVNVPELFHCRAPGNTCLSALKAPVCGRLETPINDSKGCGGVMRAAPIGLYFDAARLTLEEIDRLGAQSAALTHGHPLGYIPAAALAHIIHLLVHRGSGLEEAVQDMLGSIQEQFARTAYVQDFAGLIRRAVSLARSDTGDLEAIRQLGEGWVAEETLAIAVCCALRYEEDFQGGLTASVNHSGDSDSTGAVTGNILGARLGLRAIPSKYLERLELREVILEVASDLCRGGQGTWEEKYTGMTCQPAKG